ncbi:MAG: hypothetical protein AB1656_10220 [Candidatus Omnitrophota bacterium]
MHSAGRRGRLSARRESIRAVMDMASIFIQIRKNAYVPMRAFFVTISLTLLLYSLKWIPPVGADGWFMESLITEKGFPMYYRSILTVWIHKAFYIFLHPFGVSGWNALAASSSLAGAIALQALWAMRRSWLFLVVNVFCGSFLVFVGHVENYAWVNAFLLLAFWAAQRWLEGEGRAWPVGVFFALACLSHMLAIFYIPAMAYLFWRKRDYDPLEILIPLLAFIGLTIGLTLAFPMLGTDNGLERLVPLFHKTPNHHRFLFFDGAHFKMLASFHQRAAFLGIPIELPLLFLLRKGINSLYLRFLFVCVLCGLGWTTIWHPDWGGNDWDLFSQFAIPLHVLLGFLLTNLWKKRSKDEY